jgi:hypothetical protein
MARSIILVLLSTSRLPNVFLNIIHTYCQPQNTPNLD